LNIDKLYCVIRGYPPTAEQVMFTIAFSFPVMRDVDIVFFSATVGAENKITLELNPR